MSVRKSRSRDVAAFIPVLRKLVNLCRSLDLPNEAAVFDQMADRFRNQPPSWEAADSEMGSSLMDGCTVGPIIGKLRNDPTPFKRLWMAYFKISCPEYDPRTGRLKKKPNGRWKWKAIKDSKTFWELTGESELHAVTIPTPPRTGGRTTVRLTHSNPYGPLDKVEFHVRVGNSRDGADEDDADSASDWVQARLVEELIYVDGKEMLRSKAKKPLEAEIPWDGTYDATLVIPKGRRWIEIRIVSRHRELRSMVLSDWSVSAGKKGEQNKRTAKPGQ
jgi:hypothetical protein